MQLDEGCKNAPRIANWYDTFREKNIDLTNFAGIPDSVSLDIEPNPNTIFTGIITHPALMLHSDIHHIASMYIQGLPSKRVILTDVNSDYSELYYMIWLRKVSCLSEKSILSQNKAKYEKLVLDHTKLLEHKIFFPQSHAGTEPIVNLDVAESILRRNSCGINLIELEVV